MKATAMTLAVVSISLQLIALGIAVAPMDLFQGVWYDKSDVWNLEEWDYYGWSHVDDYFQPKEIPNVVLTTAELYMRAESSGNFRLTVLVRCNIPGTPNDTFYRGASEVYYDGPAQKWVGVPLQLSYGESPATHLWCILQSDVGDVDGLPGPDAVGWGKDAGGHHFLRVYARQYAEGEGEQEPQQPEPPTGIPPPESDPNYEPPPADYEAPSPPAAVDWRIAAVLAVVGVVLLVIAVVLAKVV